MNTRSTAMTAALLVVGLFAGIGPAQEKKSVGPPPITVRGGYINDLSCVPTDAPTLSDDAQVVKAKCTATTLWNGASPTTRRSMSLDARSSPRAADPKTNATSTRSPSGASASRSTSVCPAVFANIPCNSG